MATKLIRPPPGYLDRAVFRFDRDEYTVTVTADDSGELSAIVDHVGGDGSDGRDTVQNIAWLEFADQSHLIGSFLDTVPDAPNSGNPVMTLGVAVPMRVDFPGDKDTYAIDLVAGQTYQLSLESGGYISQNLYTLIAADGSETNLFGQGWDGYGNPHLTRSFHFEATETGRFHLQYASPPDRGGFARDYGYKISDPFAVVVDHGTNAPGATSGDDVILATQSGPYVNGGAGQDRFVADIALAGIDVSYVQWAGYFSDTAGEAPTFYLDRTVGRGPDGQSSETKHDIQVTQVETFVGSEHNDNFTVRSKQGYRHTDRVSFEGRGGNDSFDSTLGPNHFDGGAGIDTVRYGDAWFVSDESPYTAEGVRVDLTTGNGHGGAAEGDTYTSIERVFGSQSADVLIAGSTTTQLHGGNGNDWLLAGPNGHSMNGNGGSNTVSFVNLQDTPGRASAEFRIRIDLEQGKAHSFDPSQVYDLTSIERATGTIYADLLRGDSRDNELRGLGDYDWFIATEGNDSLDGGNGQDMISFLEWGGSDAATITDVFSVNGAPPSGDQVNGVLVDLATSTNNTNLADGLTMTSIERVTGSSHQDVFYGDAQQNDFRGLGGYDWFVGSTGGRERYFGGDGLDTVTYFQSTSGVSASLRNGAGLFGGQETGYGSAGDAVRDLYFEIENLVGTNFDDSLTGNNERNQLSGLDGDDFLFGYGGTDYMKGGAGDDTINGGAGSDFAIFDGNRGDYTITRSSATDVTVTGADGTDSLISVEYFQFDDETANIWQFSIA